MFDSRVNFSNDDDARGGNLFSVVLVIDGDIGTGRPIDYLSDFILVLPFPSARRLQSVGQFLIDFASPPPLYLSTPLRWQPADPGLHDALQDIRADRHFPSDLSRRTMQTGSRHDGKNARPLDFIPRFRTLASCFPKSAGSGVEPQDGRARPSGGVTVGHESRAVAEIYTTGSSFAAGHEPTAQPRKRTMFNLPSKVVQAK